MSNKKQYVQFVSPKGVAKFPMLHVARRFDNAQNRSVPDPNGQYEMTLLLSPEDAGEMKKKVDEASKLAGIKPNTVPFKKEIDKDTDKETGLIEVKLKAYGMKKDGTTNRIVFVDAKKNKLSTDFVLTSGSVVKVAGYVSVAKLGARLNLRTVQVIDYAEPVAKDTPFDEEDGYVAENTELNGLHKEETDEGDFDF